MIEPQTQQPQPEPMHVMTKAEWKRLTAAHYTLQAIEARICEVEQESKQQ